MTPREHFISQVYYYLRNGHYSDDASLSALEIAELFGEAVEAHMKHVQADAREAWPWQMSFIMVSENIKKFPIEIMIRNARNQIWNIKNWIKSIDRYIALDMRYYKALGTLLSSCERHDRAWNALEIQYKAGVRLDGYLDGYEKVVECIEMDTRTKHPAHTGAEGKYH